LLAAPKATGPERRAHFHITGPSKSPDTDAPSPPTHICTPAQEFLLPRAQADRAFHASLDPGVYSMLDWPDVGDRLNSFQPTVLYEGPQVHYKGPDCETSANGKKGRLRAPALVIDSRPTARRG